MKFALAVLIQVFLGLFLMWGMIQAVQGSYWVLLVGSLGYLVLLIRNGCTAH
jgi:hypothetical protein